MQKKEVSEQKFHHFVQSIHDIALPEKFTYPFQYIPHPLCILAAGEVQAYLNARQSWQKELQTGKMFGVLIVRAKSGEIGYLAAFSGILAGKNIHSFFVPPIYDLQQPNGFFRQEEAQISALNMRICNLENNKDYQDCRQRLEKESREAQQVAEEVKARFSVAKTARKLRRQNNPGEAELTAMIQESQYQKAELRRLKQQQKKRLSLLEAQVKNFSTEIELLKKERKSRSAALQQKLFEQFQILNARGETQDLCEIFKQTVQKIPPAGAGECAAPKLLQYAFLHDLYPLAMAEFWWGDSPGNEIRRHGYYYPACSGKCGPILGFMLQGLNVETNPLLSPLPEVNVPEILFEDEWLLVINKPAGMLSVPGKSNMISVYQQLKTRYPEATGPLLVHRLDMATSGLLLVAKTKKIYQCLQAQFKNHTIKKRYIALLDGVPAANKGTINLPLCPDFLNRPYQIVNYKQGKTAITHYQVLEHRQHQTLIAFFPVTGRTHQLRVHAAHPSGLNTPILGDELYGRKAERLYLHAEYIEFRHPITNKMICVEKKAEF